MTTTVITVDAYELRTALLAGGTVDNTIEAVEASPGHWFITSRNTDTTRARAEQVIRTAIRRS